MSARSATPRTRRLEAVVAFVSLFVAAALLAPGAATAQPGPGAEATGWPPIEIGARVGLTNVQQDFVLGALLRIPVWRTGHVELLPSGDVTFLGPFNEYQWNLDAVYLLLGRDGGPYVGGGIGFRSTIPPSAPNTPSRGRDTLTTYNLVVGLKLTSLGRVSPLFEFRRAFTPDLVVDPQLFSIGATLMLW